MVSMALSTVPRILAILRRSGRGGTTAKIFEIFTLLRGLGYRNTKEVRNFQWLQFCTCFKDWIYELPSGQIQFAHQHLKEIVEYVLLRKYLAIHRYTKICDRKWCRECGLLWRHQARFEPDADDNGRITSSPRFRWKSVKSPGSRD